MTQTELTFKALQKLSTASITKSAVVLLAEEATALQAMIDGLLDKVDHAPVDETKQLTAHR